jgi:hypothetical protein
VTEIGNNQRLRILYSIVRVPQQLNMRIWECSVLFVLPRLEDE